MSAPSSSGESAHAAEENVKFYTFFNLALFMAAVTGIELVIIFIPFADWIVFTAIVVLSVVKFVGVLAWFMHLVYDKLFCTLLFLAGLLIAIGTFTALLFLFSPKDAEPLAIQTEDSQTTQWLG